MEVIESHGAFAAEPVARNGPEPAGVRQRVGGADWPVVLVAEDHAGMRAYLRTHLAERHEVAEAADGAQALELARRPARASSSAT